MLRQEEVENKQYRPLGCRVLIVDMDTVMFRIACMTQEKRLIVTSPEGRVKVFKNITEVKKKISRDLDAYKIEEKINAEPLHNAIHSLKVKLAQLTREAKADFVELYYGGFNNFRLFLPLPILYKGQRDLVKPVNLSGLQEYSASKLGALKIREVETDDVVQMRFIQIAQQGNTPILATVDKDSYQVFQDVEGEILDINSLVTTKITGGVGEVHLTKNKEVKGTGLNFLISQIFLFDQADNYKLNSFYKKRFGAMSYIKAFSHLKTEVEVLETALGLWLKLLPEKTKYIDCFGEPQEKTRLELIELYFKCAYMRVEPNDPMTFEKLLGLYKVELPKGF